VTTKCRWVGIIGAALATAISARAPDAAASSRLERRALAQGAQVSVDSLGNPAPAEPDPAITPGATLPVTTADICVPGYSRKIRNVPIGVKRDVYRRYGIVHHVAGEYEVDHLISLELGGSNSERNLWPQSYWTSPWNAHLKDALENTLHRQVCAGRIPLETAQHDIAADWVAAYRKYVKKRRAA
jgi:hypothetical protein